MLPPPALCTMSMQFHHLYFLTLQVKRFLEHVNSLLPNLSQNLFILFNQWDRVEDDSDDDYDDPERLKEQHLERARTFFEQSLKAKAVVDRIFFVSGREACKAQKDKEKGKQSTAGRSVVYMQSPYFSMVMSSPHVQQLSVNTTATYILNVMLYTV